MRWMTSSAEVVARSALLVETLGGEHHVRSFEGNVAVGGFEVPPDRLKGGSCQGREFELVEVGDLC